ncbi:MAG: alpha/beta hydrolase, partial [Actinomycetota bacterium]
PARVGISQASFTGSGRLRTYTVDSAVEGEVRVNVLLPADYDPSGRTRYPVLYLLHGSQGSYADWANSTIVADVPQGGDVQAIVGSLPLIVVMPDDSPNGAYSDWYGVSRLNQVANSLGQLLGGTPVQAPAWETFDIGELIPWVDSTFPTEASAAGRAIAGASSGGSGAAKLAAAHPGLFGFVGTFSGADDTDLVDSTIDWYAGAEAISGSGDPDATCTFGDPYAALSGVPGQQFYWEDNDPTAEASNLAGTKIWVASGDGIPGPLDGLLGPQALNEAIEIENVVDDMSQRFVSALRSAGLGREVTTDFYGDGVHDWSYFQADLDQFLVWLAPQLGRSRPAPTPFSFENARINSSAWGWTFAHHSGLSIPNVNTAEEFVYLTKVSRAGLTAAGHGTLAVTTPAGTFAPSSVHTVTAGGTKQRLTAGRNGSLSFRVTLGPQATMPQAVFPAGPPPGTPQVQVSIR